MDARHTLTPHRIDAQRVGGGIIGGVGAMANAEDDVAGGVGPDGEATSTSRAAVTASMHASDAAQRMRASKRTLRCGVAGARACAIGATCYVHFSLTDIETGEIVRNTRADAEPIQFVCSERTSRDDRIVGRGAGSNIPALDVCAVGLATGERATFEAPAELAYGETGNFSFPTVGKNRALLLDIEVLGVLGSADAPDELQSDMTYEARIERVKRHRANGNELFTTGDAMGAIREYSMALTYLTEDFMMQLFDKYEIEANQEYAALHGNLCAAYLKLNAFEDVITHAGYVLKVDTNNAKAYYRRGKARASLGQDNAAREDFLKAKKITEDAGTKDANVVKALRELDIEMRAREKASSEVFKGMFTMTRSTTATSAANTANVTPEHAPRGLFSRWFGSKPR